MGNKQGQAGYQQFDDKKRKKSDKFEKYDPDQIPPVLQLALDHQNARRVGDEKEPQQGKEVNICDCCGYNVDREIMDINCNTNDLSFLGAGYPLFFDYIRYCIYMLLIIFIISGVFNLVTNVMTSDCVTYDEISKQIKKSNPFLGSKELYALTMKKSMNPKICVESFWTNMSLSNKKDHEGLLKVQGILNFIVILIIVCFLQLMRRSQRQLETIADEKNISPTDYSVMVKHIENDKEGIDYDDQLKKIFQNKGVPGKSVHVKKINLCFDLDEIQALQKQKTELIALKQKGLKAAQSNNGVWPANIDPFEKIEKQHKEIDNQIEKLEKEMREGKTTKFCGVAFISFNTEQEKTDVLQHNTITWMQRLKQALGVKISEQELEQSKKKDPAKHDLVWEGRKLVIEEAPEPSDVNWVYQGVPSTKKQVKRVISFLITLGLLGLSFVTILYLNGRQRFYLENKKKYPHRAQFFGILISLIIILINAFLNIFIKKLAMFENFSTQTRYNISIAVKNVWAIFFNSALILFFVAYMYQKNVIGKGGLIENVSKLFFMQFITKCIEEIVCAGYYTKVIQQKLVLKDFEGERTKSVLTQQQLNTIFENPEFDIASKYAVIASLMFFTAFYAAVIPSGLIFAILELIAYYWILKYNLLRRSMVKYCIGAELSRELTELIEYIVVINAIANFIFYVILHQGKISLNFFTILTFIGLIIGIANAFLPMKEINEKLFEVKGAEDLKMTYDEAENKFDSDYDRENPATKSLANEEYRKRRENANKHKGFSIF